MSPNRLWQHAFVAAVLATMSLVMYGTRVADGALQPDEVQLKTGVALLGTRGGA
jgi:hypothetical protein